MRPRRYTAADWYHEVCAHTLVDAHDSAVVAASMSKVSNKSSGKQRLRSYSLQHYNAEYELRIFILSYT